MRRFQIALLTFLLLAFYSTLYTDFAHADIRLKIAVVNPSAAKEQTMPVRFDLPRGIEPSDIIDIHGMELKYAFDKGVYYVYQVLTLRPSEKKILEVELRDIWLIPDKEIKRLNEHTDAMTVKLKKTKHFKDGSTLAKKIEERLDEITAKQEESSLNTRSRINSYYENIASLEQAKEEIGMLENLVIDTGGIVEERVKVPATLAVVVPGEAGGEDLIDLKIRVSNPSADKPQTTSVKYDLPKEVMPAHVADAGGLNVAYNFDKECFYLYKDGVELTPSETKIFEVKVKDIWRIPRVEIDNIGAHTDNLMLLIKGSGFYSQGKPLADRITANLKRITDSQSLKITAAQHIAAFRDNTDIMSETKKYAAQLERLVTQSGTTPGVTIAKAERLKGGGKVVQRQKGYEGLKLIAESIFKGKAPTAATMWKVIFAILAFIGILGALFFALWYVQIKRGK